MANSVIKFKLSNDHNLLDIPISNFKNEDYILKLNSMHMLKFFKDELTIKYSGKGYNSIDFASTQSNKPINKNNAIFYYEVEILDEGSKKDITIGFSDKEFVLNKQCGTTSKSYGYNGDGKVYHDKSKGDIFGPKFKLKDVIGCGYYFSKNSIFYTINGKFIEWAFKNVEYQNFYPTISLHSLNEKVTVNFGKQTFVFDIEGFYYSQMTQKMDCISQEKVEKKDMDYLIREYLVHSGYQESFMALDKEYEYNPVDLDYDENYDGLSWKKDLSEKNELYKKNSLNEFDRGASGMEVDDVPYDIDKLRKYSQDEGLMKEPQIRKRTLSLIMERNNNETENNPDIFLIINFLKERKIIHNMIMDREYETALSYFETNFKIYKTKKEISFRKIILCLTTLKYLEKIKNNEYIEAYQILNKLDGTCWNKDISILMYDSSDKVCDYTLEQLSVLLCYENVLNSEFKYFFTEKQISVVCDQINSLILELAGLSSESVLERIIKQQTMVGYLYRNVKNCMGEKIGVKI